MTLEHWLRQHYYVPEEAIDQGVLVNNHKIYDLKEQLEEGDIIIVTQPYDLGIKTYVVE
jgi:hypothetical protein